jgi:MFS family permease
MSQSVVIASPARSLKVMRRALFLSSFPIGVLTLGIPIYGPDRLHLNAVEVGALISIYALMMLVMRPIVGAAMDRFGRRRFFIAGMVLQLMSNIFFAAGSSFAWLFFGRAMQGIAAGLLWLSAYAITADLAAEGKHGNLFGSVEEMLARGGLYGAAIGAPILLITQFDPIAWAVVFGFYAALNGVGLYWAWKHLPETYHKAPPQAIHFAIPSVSRQMLILISIVLCTSIANAALAPITIQFVLHDIKFPVIVVALAYIPSAIVFSFLQSRLGKLADRVGRKRPIALGLITSGTSSAIVPNLVFLLPFIGGWALLPLVVLWISEAVGFSAATPAEQALVADLSGEKSRGRSFGLYTSAQSLGQVIGPTLGGTLYESISHSAPFYFNTVVLWLGAAILILLIRDPYQRTPASQPVLPHEPPAQWPSAGGGK